MSSPEVEFVLRRIDEYYGAGALEAGTTAAGEDVPLRLVDRDESLIWDSGEALDMSTAVHKRTDELTRSNFVGATLADDAPTPIGTEYDHRMETVVGVRIEGLTHREWGHVDPRGRQGAPWTSLVETIKRAVLRDRTFPDTHRPDTAHTDCRLTNIAPQSSLYSDYYRYDFDVLLTGFQTLPGQ